MDDAGLADVGVISSIDWSFYFLSHAVSEVTEFLFIYSVFEGLSYDLYVCVEESSVEAAANEDCIEFS